MDRFIACLCTNAALSGESMNEENRNWGKHRLCYEQGKLYPDRYHPVSAHHTWSPLWLVSPYSIMFALHFNKEGNVYYPLIYSTCAYKMQCVFYALHTIHHALCNPRPPLHNAPKQWVVNLLHLQMKSSAPYLVAFYYYKLGVVIDCRCISSLE